MCASSVLDLRLKRLPFLIVFICVIGVLLESVVIARLAAVARAVEVGVVVEGLRRVAAARRGRQFVVAVVAVALRRVLVLSQADHAVLLVPADVVLLGGAAVCDRGQLTAQ